MNRKKVVCIFLMMVSFTGCARHAVVSELEGLPRVPINKQQTNKQQAQAQNTQVFVKNK